MLSYITTRSISRSPQLRSRLIKFRYGPARDQQTSSAQHSGGGDQKKGALAAPGEPIYDFQIPPRWRRKPLSEEEIAVINNGGPV
ncbi:unnamed protein product [Callosobruchus maculatus]|uniref:28S ribosomal protein S36, mitochondrial n=1 Tax=Callosobruchus maculatus TaxID=64391 RepID=A0A653D7C1_CALMS|nr:unnamed protein product [Callosobruchus maculatus]